MAKLTTSPIRGMETRPAERFRCNLAGHVNPVTAALILCCDLFMDFRAATVDFGYFPFASSAYLLPKTVHILPTDGVPSQFASAVQRKE